MTKPQQTKLEKMIKTHFGAFTINALNNDYCMNLNYRCGWDEPLAVAMFWCDLAQAPQLKKHVERVRWDSYGAVTLQIYKNNN